MPIRDLGVYLGVVLLIRVGQTLLLAGMVRSKNAAGAAVRCVLDLAVVVLALWAIGGVFLPGLDFDGSDRSHRWIFFNHAFGNSGFAWTLLPAMLVATIAALGATAERVRVLPLLAFSAVTGSFVLPLIWRIGLWLNRGFVVSEPSLFVAVVGGGVAALVLAWVAGPRKGKFNRDLSVNFVPGHAVVFQFVGLILLSAGFGVACRNGMHALLGLCAAALAGAAFGKMRFGKLDGGLLIASGVGGLCAGGIAAVASGVQSNWLGDGGAPAVLAGLLAGVAVPWAVMLVETRLRIDDVAGFGVAYVVSGTIGMVMAALTRHSRTVGEYFGAMIIDLILWVVVIIMFGLVGLAIGKFFAARNALRVGETAEYDGVDLSDLDVNAYPDFQQTMIKSHHLRQL